MDCSPRLEGGAMAGLGREICFEGLWRALSGLTFLGGGRRGGGAPVPLGVLPAVGALAGEALMARV